MTTTTNAHDVHTKDLALRTVHPNGEGLRKRLKGEHKKRLIFGLIAFFASIAFGLVLFAFGEGAHQAALAGETTDAKFLYDDWLGRLVAGFNAALMVFPIIVIYKNKRHVLPRLAVVAGSIVFPLLLLPLWARIAEGMAVNLFALAGVPGFLGLMLNAVAAVLLTYYRAVDPTLVDDKAELPFLRSGIEAAKAAKTAAGVTMATYATRKSDLETAHEALKADEVEKSALYDEAKAAHENEATNPQIRARRELKEKLDANLLAEPSPETRATLVEEIEKLDVRMDKATKVVRTELEARKAAKEAALTAMQELSTELAIERERLQRDLNTLDEQIELSPTKVALNRALAASNLAADNAKDGLELLEGNGTPALPGATKRDADATKEFADKGEIVTQLEEQYTAKKLSVDERTNDAESFWRDMAFWASACLLLANLFGYITYYGWVVTSF